MAQVLGRQKQRVLDNILWLPVLSKGARDRSTRPISAFACAIGRRPRGSCTHEAPARSAIILATLAVAVLAGGCAGGSRELVAEFANVGDLVGRSNVQQSDAVVGTVRSIELVQREDEWVARVTMRIDPDTRVTTRPRPSSGRPRFSVRSSSTLSRRTKSGRELREGEVLPSSNDKAPELEDLFSQLGSILATGALEDLAKITRRAR